ncbi:MAG: sulfur oxidation c-type cytochrome SoxA [Betaproteobacteria bacterium]|nr:sulfur oxidation c-type cytochrome SoxA [Betaproteobacteria bacterium]
MARGAAVSLAVARIGAALLAVACAVPATLAYAQSSTTRVIPLDQLKSGLAYTGEDVRALQADDFANPGMLWVERGEKIWNTPAGADGKSCASCHGDAKSSMKGVAARYPAIDAKSKQLLNIEARINASRSGDQKAPAFAPESEDMLAITAYVNMQSRGVPVGVSIDGAAREHFERGRAFYYTRRGQMNMSCATCHEQNFGKRLFAETISQGQPNDFPIYRLEWQTMGSLHRRLRACLYGVRAELLPVGSPELLDVELFLAWRAQGLKGEAPAVRR